MLPYLDIRALLTNVQSYLYPWPVPFCNEHICLLNFVNAHKIHIALWYPKFYHARIRTQQYGTNRMGIIFHSIRIGTIWKLISYVCMRPCLAIIYHFQWPSFIEGRDCWTRGPCNLSGSVGNIAHNWHWVGTRADIFSILWSRHRRYILFSIRCPQLLISFHFRYPADQ